MESLILADVKHRLTYLFSDNFNYFSGLIESLNLRLLDSDLRCLNYLRCLIDDINLSI